MTIYKQINNEKIPLNDEELKEYNQRIEDDKNKPKIPEYVYLRQAEYPSVQDCIHALLDGGDTLTELQEKRQEIKVKYPKS